MSATDRFFASVFALVFAFAFTALMQYQQAAHADTSGHPVLAATACALLVGGTATAVIAAVATARQWCAHATAAVRARARRHDRPVQVTVPAAVVPFAVHGYPARIVWAPPDRLPDPAHADAVAALALAHRADEVVVAMPPAAEQAARIFLEVAWRQLHTERACPRVLADEDAALAAAPALRG